MNTTPAPNAWDRFQEHYLRYEDLGFSLDISRMHIRPGFFNEMEPLCARARDAMAQLEAGAIANPDENRMVGHYWLRTPSLAPTPELAREIETSLGEVLAFAGAVHSGSISSPGGKRFRHLLLAGIGGSALGPQLVADALTGPGAPLSISFLDNTDPDGIDRTLAENGARLEETLVLVVSKSGGTKETRNGMLETANAFRARGLAFARHAVAVTGPGSHLDDLARAEGWLRRFAMFDWVGGRTSVMSAVGLLPAALQGVDVRGLLAGAAAMDEKTRSLPTPRNASMLLALMWHSAGGGRGGKDMVVLPYRDRLALLSRYLQQLVMESLGKERDLQGRTVHQGIAVYGNKGSTDQHAYVQQLRDGLNNFFATFIEVHKARAGGSIEVDPGITSGDYLQGFMRGTRTALTQSGRESITLSIAQLDAFSLGLLLALFERAVSFYASLVNVNAYHQPGVEAGKKAAGEFLARLGAVRARLAKEPGRPHCAPDLAASLAADPEEVFHILNHLAANDARVSRRAAGESPSRDAFTWA